MSLIDDQIPIRRLVISPQDESAKNRAGEGQKEMQSWPILLCVMFVALLFVVFNLNFYMFEWACGLIKCLWL